jgi:hypothetical protein
MFSQKNPVLCHNLLICSDKLSCRSILAVPERRFNSDSLVRYFGKLIEFDLATKSKYEKGIKIGKREEKFQLSVRIEMKHQKISSEYIKNRS